MLLKHKENFIIPFIYQNLYVDLCKQLKESDYFSKIEELQETELHAFINRRFWQEENGHCEVYRVNTNQGRDVLVSLYDTENDTDIDISDIRFYVFKSGIMFAVVSAEYKRGADGLSLYIAEEINSALKDLYVHDGRFLLFDKNLKLSGKFEYPERFENTYGLITKNGEPDGNGKQKVMLSPLVKKEEEQDVPAVIELFVNKKTGGYLDFEDGFFTPVKNKPNMLKCYRQTDFSLAMILDKVLARLSIRTEDYFASSKNTIYPKKAVVFNMHVLDNDKELVIGEQLFYLAHGYTHSYKYSQTDENIVSTFDNSYWKAAREGAANINLVTQKDGDHFLHHEFANRFDSIYLWIMILVLHQYYGLQYFTCELMRIYQESLQIEKNELKKEYAKLLGQMEEIKNRGDLFLLQYVFVDISQISHQNDIYTHICQVYNIKGLIEDYKTNAEICDKLLARKQQKSLQKKVNFIAVMSTFFTLFTAITQTLMGLFEFDSAFSYVLRVLLGIAGIGLVIIGLMKTNDGGNER